LGENSGIRITSGALREDAEFEVWNMYSAPVHRPVTRKGKPGNYGPPPKFSKTFESVNKFFSW